LVALDALVRVQLGGIGHQRERVCAIFRRLHTQHE
jgi:hypothetical protein